MLELLCSNLHVCLFGAHRYLTIFLLLETRFPVSLVVLTLPDWKCL